MQQTTQGEFDSQAFEDELVEEGEEPTLNTKSVSEQPSKYDDFSFYLGRMYLVVNKVYSTTRANSAWTFGQA